MPIYKTAWDLTKCVSKKQAVIRRLFFFFENLLHNKVNSGATTAKIWRADERRIVDCWMESEFLKRAWAVKRESDTNWRLIVTSFKKERAPLLSSEPEGLIISNSFQKFQKTTKRIENRKLFINTTNKAHVTKRIWTMGTDTLCIKICITNQHERHYGAR